jgi:cytoskeletal protein RodZ
MALKNDPGASSPAVGDTGQPVSGSAGEILRREREKRNISVEAVAKTLRLNARYIEALESDRYEQLPGDTYIRVYLRSLSRFLSLDSEEIFQRFFKERGVTGADTLRKDSRTKINLAAQEEKKSNTSLIAIFSAIALLAVFSFMVNRQGCRSAPDSKHSRAAADVSASGIPAVESDLQKTVRGGAQQGSTGMTASAGKLKDTVTLPQKTGSAAVKKSGAADTPKALKNPEIRQEVKYPGDDHKSVSVIKDSVPVPRTIADTAGKTGPKPAHIQTDSGLMSLRMTVVGDSCWGRIISDGNKEWKNTVTAGKGASFTARDSFNVHVGIGDAVTFTLNGRQLELPRKKGVLTFKVDRSGAVWLWPLDKWNSVFEKKP